MIRILLFLLCLSMVSFSQEKGELHLNIGLNYPTIGFVDSQGNEALLSDFNNASSNHLKLGYKRKFAEDFGFLLSIASNRYDVLARYGFASNSFNYVNYNLDYLSGSLALTFDFKLTNHLVVVPNLGVSYNYLMSGFQYLDNVIYNLKEDKDFVPYSFSVNPGVYISKSISPFLNVHLGYNYVFDLESNERTTTQSYNLKSHSVFVGAAIKIGSLISEIDKQKKVDYKLTNLERSFSEMKQGMDDVRLYIDSIFITGTNSNSKLQSEIEKHIGQLNLSQDSLIADFVVLFPSNNSQYYSLFDDTMEDLLEVALSPSCSDLRIVGYADLNGADQSNLILSKNRTETIRNYLIDNGADSEKISIEFLGETSMFDSNVLMSNRRVEIFIRTN